MRKTLWKLNSFLGPRTFCLSPISHAPAALAGMACLGLTLLSTWSPAGGTVLEGVEVQKKEPCQRKWVRWEQNLRLDSFTPAAVLCYLNSETLWPMAWGSCPRPSTPWGPVSFQTTNQNRSFLHWVASYPVSQHVMLTPCTLSRRHGMLTLHTLSREQRKTPPRYKSANDKRHEDDRVRGSQTHPVNYKITQAQWKFMSLMLLTVLVYSYQELRSII